MAILRPRPLEAVAPDGNVTFFSLIPYFSVFFLNFLQEGAIKAYIQGYSRGYFGAMKPYFGLFLVRKGLFG